MVARYRIQHTSRYEYHRGVVASFNEARITPLQLPWQIRLESTVAIDPVAWTYRYTDYWGTDVRAFETSGPHRSLEIRASSLVELDCSRRPVAPEDLEWSVVRDSATSDEFAEYLTQSRVTEPPTELADLAASIAADNPPAQAARLIGRAVHDALTYTSGVTEVTTSAAEAWEARTGVCQDYTHLVLGALRSVGMPARYVSGYLDPRGPGDPSTPGDEPTIGRTVVGESHAWVECWHGDWSPIDPTNTGEVSERHVMVGTGRDYADVPPVKGILAGPQGTSALEVTVELTRLA
jgi:transglutaminase-like putative cysteine protease